MVGKGAVIFGACLHFTINMQWHTDLVIDISTSEIINEIQPQVVTGDATEMHVNSSCEKQTRLTTCAVFSPPDEIRDSTKCTLHPIVCSSVPKQVRYAVFLKIHWQIN